ncbi:hypothetical protein BKA70DRAFT_1222150 [Coprinopsis sp. MPI-PUGE-AT-0042]|nr:hypothetical protein BKA70DRAFT_1222150 [Coprinopsis sp. MPI-PUGE-AT-0042]
MDPSNTAEGLEAFHGPLVIGYGASAFLFGVISLKTASYFRSYGNEDPATLKGTILAVWRNSSRHTRFLELVHSCIACAIVYTVGQSLLLQRFLVTDPYTLKVSSGLPESAERPTAVSYRERVSLPRRDFKLNPRKNYGAYRLHKITDSIWTPLLVLTCSSVRTIIFFIGTVVQVGPFPHLQTHVWKKVMTSVGILGILTDSTLATALARTLWKRRREFQALRAQMDPGGRQPTNSLLHHSFDVVDELILFCIGTNVSTVLSAIVVFVLYHLERNLIWLPISYVQTRMYALSFIALVLESRKPNPSMTTPRELLHAEIFGRSCQCQSLPVLGTLPSSLSCLKSRLTVGKGNIQTAISACWVPCYEPTTSSSRMNRPIAHLGIIQSSSVGDATTAVVRAFTGVGMALAPLRFEFAYGLLSDEYILSETNTN